MPVFYGLFREIIYRSVDFENQEAGLESKYQDLPYGQRVYVGSTRPSVTKPIQRPIKSTFWNSNGTGPPISVASPTDHTDTPDVSGGGPESRAERVSQGTPSRKLRGRSRRGRCPPGHYWSWKKKTCVKSKYR